MLGSDNLSAVVLTDNLCHQSSNWSREVIRELLVDSRYSTRISKSLGSMWNQCSETVPWSLGIGSQGLRRSQQRQFEWVSPHTHTGRGHGLRLTLLTLLNNQSERRQEGVPVPLFLPSFPTKISCGWEGTLRKSAAAAACHLRWAYPISSKLTDPGLHVNF